MLPVLPVFPVFPVFPAFPVLQHLQQGCLAAEPGGSQQKVALLACCSKCLACSAGRKQIS